MRVLHVVQTLRGGGAETLVRELLPRLERRGVDVGALSAYDAALSADERRDLPYALYESQKRGRLDLTFPLRFTAAIRTFRPDVVHTHTQTGKYWGRACAVSARVPHIVHTEHSSEASLPSWERTLTRFLVPATTTYVTFSERTAALLRSREAVPRLTTIANGIQIEAAPSAADREAARRALGAGPGVVIVGVVGNLQPVKNHVLAIEALARFAPAQRAGIRLDFFGRGPEEPALRALAAERGVADRITFWGFRSDVRELLPGLDVVLSVSARESAPISLLEAMAAGVPLVATPTMGALDLIVDGETGLVSADWSPARLGAALERAVASAEWRARAGAAGRARLVEHFDIERIADQHVDLYRGLVRN